MATYNDSGVLYSESTTTYNGDPVTPSFPSGGNPWIARQQPVSKKVVERQPVIVYGSAVASFTFTASASGRIMWSILDDEADLLLLI